MRIVFSPIASDQLASQIRYLVGQDAPRAAARLKHRVLTYIKTTVARFPKASRYIAEKDLYETWIPRTPYVVMYRLDAAAHTITIVALFHAARDRNGFDPSRTE
jgi:plasmid stabilization system protein ParE